MVEMTATCWTINLMPTRTVTGRGLPAERMGVIMGKQRRTKVRLDLDNGAAGVVYPNGGIPLPTRNATTPKGDSSYGMRRNIDYMIYVGERMATSAAQLLSAPIWKYDSSKHKIRGFGIVPIATTFSADPTPSTHGLVEIPTTWTVTHTNATAPAVMLDFEVIGW